VADCVLQTAPRISLSSVMPNKRKIVAPTQEELRRFDALADREVARFMLNWSSARSPRRTARSCRLNTGWRWSVTLRCGVMKDPSAESRRNGQRVNAHIQVGMF